MTLSDAVSEVVVLKTPVLDSGLVSGWVKKEVESEMESGVSGSGLFVEKFLDIAGGTMNVSGEDFTTRRRETIGAWPQYEST